MSIAEKLNARRTYKVIGNVKTPVGNTATDRQVIDAMLAASANAPFHCACDRLHKETLTSCVPWRAYKLDGKTCNNLMNKLIESGNATKVPNMLAAADYMVQVTWLPDEGTIINRDASKDEQAFVGTMRNMEHIAAASAFIQSLLLAGEEQGYMTYWSSGGALKSASVFEQIGIPLSELLLGSIFFFSRKENHPEIKPGSMKDARGAVDDWSNWCQIS